MWWPKKEWEIRKNKDTDDNNSAKNEMRKCNKKSSSQKFSF